MVEGGEEEEREGEIFKDTFFSFSFPFIVVQDHSEGQYFEVATLESLECYPPKPFT